ncbi:sugar nucleotide-binding protein [Viridibacillus sp. YIM B01967]|uniref:dTDP-4-dehydrorhamnose reductase n=1 Tax=Viridibacillus soli TaxID=2798301 RepID=A0ABS1H601_9BACL|nr:sugar nucleotide-binding protein [Viridibacillus soli]MBK3494837.1 sugar nucleotide-binding protein [Viridibacillus soli]
MEIFLIGSNGMLGQAIHNIFKDKGINIITISRSNSDYDIDLMYESDMLMTFIEKKKPNIVINTVAMINLLECENNPENAYLLNGRLPGQIANACRKANSYFIQISTDHFYINDYKFQHSEEDPIYLLNEYARTKFIGETLSLTYRNTLVIRTNIVGFRNKENSPTFAEWVFSTLEKNEKINAFEDFYTSSIDVYHFSYILLELIEKRITGIVNLAAKDVLSKYEFIVAIATRFEKEYLVEKGSLKVMKGIDRANSLGLNVNKLEEILTDNVVPTSNEVIESLCEKYKEGEMHGL